MAPIKVAVFPLVKNKPELMEKARSIYESIQLRHNAFWDVSGAIGEQLKNSLAHRSFGYENTQNSNLLCRGVLTSPSFSVAMTLGGLPPTGRRYRRMDEAGTPFCVTVDFDTLEDGSVTVRDRDSTEQTRVPGDELLHFLSKSINGYE